MNRRLVLILFISTLVFSSCGIPSIYVPNSSDLKLNKDYAEINTAVINSNLVRSGFPTLNIFYEIVPEGVSYPASTVLNNFSKDYCSETSGRFINKYSNHAFYNYQYSTKINDESVTPTFGLYQFRDANTQDVINIPISGLDSLLNNKWDYSFNYNELDNTIKLEINTAQGLIEYNLLRFNGASFSLFDTPYISNEVPIQYEVSSDITDYNLRIYGLITLQFNEYNNIYNTKPVEIFSFDLGLL